MTLFYHFFQTMERTWTKKIEKFLSWISLHTRFANIASLNLTNSLKPNPPSFLGLQSVSQFFQWIFLRSLLSPHQNFHISISISLHRSTESLKHPIAKVSIAWTTTFNNTSFPTWYRSFSFHLCNLLQTRSFI